MYYIRTNNAIDDGSGNVKHLYMATPFGLFLATKEIAQKIIAQSSIELEMEIQESKKD